MKKSYPFSVILLFVSLPIFAQRVNYISEYNGQQTAIIWQEKRANEKIYLSVTQGNEQHEYVMNKSFQTEKWSVVSQPSNTDLTIELHNGKYLIVGKFKGKSISKTIVSKGYVWYQNIAYNAGILLTDKCTVKYECFRPDNIELYAMVAEAKGSEKFDGINSNKITVSLTGFLSVFWSCSYYFDPTTLNFIGYKGVNGRPGTPETIIKQVK